MKLKVILVCTLLLLAASPSFALPICAEFIEATNTCEELPGSIERCQFNTITGLCYTQPLNCRIPFSPSTVLADWKVASVEISNPAEDCVTVTAPDAAAEVQTPATQTTELK